jgi:hypothetical protein
MNNSELIFHLFENRIKDGYDFLTIDNGIINDSNKAMLISILESKYKVQPTTSNSILRISLIEGEIIFNYNSVLYDSIKSFIESGERDMEINICYSSLDYDKIIEEKNTIIKLLTERGLDVDDRSTILPITGLEKIRNKVFLSCSGFDFEPLITNRRDFIERNLIWSVNKVLSMSSDPYYEIEIFKPFEYTPDEIEYEIRFLKKYLDENSIKYHNLLNENNNPYDTQHTFDKELELSKFTLGNFNCITMWNGTY